MAESLLAAQRDYVQLGHEHFESHHRDLAAHMRAAARLAAAPPLPNPQVTGTLSAADQSTLWTIIQYAGSNWNLTQYATLTQPTLGYYLGLKTQQTPSYFTVYGMATQLYSTLYGLYGPGGALTYLYAPTQPNPLPNWDVVRAWVIQEFANLWVLSGAYKAYGWWLFPGDPGGPFNNPNNLPYRT